MQNTSGYKVPDKLIQEWSKYLTENCNVSVVYGLSEFGSVVSMDCPQSGRKDTIGQLTSGTVVKIVDGDGNRCGPNTEGEICAKSSAKLLGYFNDEKATRELFDLEGFIITGDIGHFDNDGYLYFVDRKKDSLIYHDHIIRPSEIENLLMQRPEIDSVCVVGIPDEYGTNLIAAVVMRSQDMDITDETILKLVADHFADFDHYKLRGGVYFVESFPFSRNGKLLRRKVTELATKWFHSVGPIQ